MCCAVLCCAVLCCAVLCWVARCALLGARPLRGVRGGAGCCCCCCAALRGGRWRAPLPRPTTPAPIPPPCSLPRKQETQTKAEGQIHFFPILFDGRQLYELMAERCGPPKA